MDDVHDRLGAERIDERARELWIASGQPAGGAAVFRHQAAAELREAESAYDKALADSFPASDPPANSGITD
jgi:Protein of unknown function (DUF2934)